MEVLVEKKEYRKGLLLLDSVPQTDLTEEDIFNKAICKSGLRDYDGAMEELKILLRKNSSIPYLYFAVAKLLERQGKIEQAVYYYNMASTKKETRVPSREALANLEEYGEAEEEVDKENQLIGYLKPFKSDITFKDVIGLGHIDKKGTAKNYLYNHVILALQEPKLYKKYGKKLGTGLILYGSAGSGKTYITKALAGETGTFVFIARINQLLGQYVGSSEKNIQKLFNQARIQAPSIIVFDELDALGGSRSDNGEEGSSDTSRKVVGELLTQMAGFEKNPEGIFIIGTTNLPWDIDSSLKRSGRFGDALYIPPPNYQDRKELFKFYLKGKPLGRINYERLSRATLGYSSADIEKIADHSTLNPILREFHKKKEGELITMHDLLDELRNTPSTLDEWMTSTSKAVLGYKDRQKVDGKWVESWKAGKLAPEEKIQYRDLIKDVKRSTSKWALMHKKFQRLLAFYVY